MSRSFSSQILWGPDYLLFLLSFPDASLNAGARDGDRGELEENMQMFSLDERKREANVCRKYYLGSNSRKETRKISFETVLKKARRG